MGDVEEITQALSGCLDIVALWSYNGLSAIAA
jgi:hypothetical protein